MKFVNVFAEPWKPAVKTSELGMAEASTGGAFGVLATCEVCGHHGDALACENYAR